MNPSVRKQFRGFLAALVAASAVAISQSAWADATLTSDKDDYAPLEIAELMGSGFWSDEPIDVSISVYDPDSGVVVADYDWDQFLADPTGGFMVWYVIPMEASGMTLTATALGLNSGSVASVTFTDSHFTLVSAAISATGNTVSVTVEIGGGTPLPGGVTAIIQRPLDTDISLVLSFVTGSNGTPSEWFGEFEGECETTYTLRHVHVSQVPPHAGGGAQFNNLASNPPGIITTATTDLCEVLECPENAAPSISAPDLDLGAVVGCLNGSSFKHVADISVDDFGYSTIDPDGDPVDVSLNVSQVTLVGPGVACMTVTLTATDDSSGPQHRRVR